MRLLALALIAAIVPAGANAQRRPDATAMTCNAARALVARSGALVMNTGPSTYDRIVYHRGFCTPSETTDPAFVPTLDDRACMIGYTCREQDIETDR